MVLKEKRYFYKHLLVLTLITASLGHGRVKFDRDIRPILSNHCFACHGPDEKQRKGDLRLDQKESVLHSGKDAPVIPGKPDSSQLFLRITHQDLDERMPPKKFHKPLNESQIQLLKAWIEEGATWEKHWAYEKPKKAELPMEGKDGSPIDRFILARLSKEKLAPGPAADPRTLVRRLHLDLLGLPPEPKAVEKYVSSPTPNAYEKLVDALLASPHFGERLALPWLDLVRYADSVGYHKDRLRDCWLYRDYVIRAFNRNKSFDRFVHEQLAGDLITTDDPDERQRLLIASGFNRLNQTTSEGGAQAKEYVAKYAADRVRNAGAIFLGTTLGCAECHDHKYDPFTMRDFYAFAAFFADVKERGVGYPEHTQHPTFETLDQKRAIKGQIADFQTKRKNIILPEEGVVLDEKITALKVRLKELENAKKWPKAMVTTTATPRMVRLLPRGNWLDDSGEVMRPAPPSFMGNLGVFDFPDETRPNRLHLAHWITSRENPLTARVFVNRIWKLFFGKGLSRNLDDLGVQGEPPTHPELLDYLAVNFMKNGWDVKRLVREIVLTKAYRRSSQYPQSFRKDPENRLLARQSIFRLDAEHVRDMALAASGLITRKIGGRSVKPYQPANYWFRLYNTGKYVQDKGDELYRRGIYTLWRRSFWHPSLQAFDAPAREECVAERPVSNTPQQALVLLNDPTYVAAARFLAQRLLKEVEDDEARLRRGFLLTLARPPSKAESGILSELLAKHRAHYTQDEAAAQALLKTGEKSADATLPAAELAAWTSVSRALLNLHETITRN